VLLIKPYGMYGAAWSSFITNFAFLTLVYVQPGFFVSRLAQTSIKNTTEGSPAGVHRDENPSRAVLS
ncbi:MAG: hypothetical protein P8Z49_05540, partial [Acidobacteriota bacterium]